MNETSAAAATAAGIDAVPVVAGTGPAAVLASEPVTARGVAGVAR